MNEKFRSMTAKKLKETAIKNLKLFQRTRSNCHRPRLEFLDSVAELIRRGYTCRYVETLGPFVFPGQEYGSLFFKRK